MKVCDIFIILQHIRLIYVYLYSNLFNMSMREVTIKLKDNELPAKVNTEDGDVEVIATKISTMPEGMSRLDYENFGMINLDMLPILHKYLTHTEISIVVSMIMRADYSSNSLAPLSNETSIRQLAEIFGISPTIVKKTFDKLFRLGVYLQIKVYEEQLNEYWVLNPYIYWKGRLKSDSIFKHFANTDITKLLK